jgi:hypothetical protein
VNLIGIRTEVLNRGFDQGLYGGRINAWANDALTLIARRVNYLGDEATQTYSTVAGTATYQLPQPTQITPTWAQSLGNYTIPSGGFARLRELFRTDTNQSIEAALLQDIDRASSTVQGAPYWYALDGQNLRLYPTPDNIYPLELRYWQMPAALSNDQDVPAIPADWHRLLVSYCTWQAFECDDDQTVGGYWKQRFEQELAEFAADQRFPDDNMPHQAQSMWDVGVYRRGMIGYL